MLEKVRKMQISAEPDVQVENKRVMGPAAAGLREISWSCRGNVRQASWKFPRHFQKFPGNVQEMSGKNPRIGRRKKKFPPKKKNN